MAIIRSVAIGKARKSIGNVTFRTVRGRTIGSEKRGGATTRAPETIFQFKFALLSRFVRIHRYDIDLSFDKSKYGSQGNRFQKVNKDGIYAAFDSLYVQGFASSAISDDEINTAVATYATANPTKIYRVLKAGYETKYLTGDWSSSDNPDEPVVNMYVESNEGLKIPVTYTEGATKPADGKTFGTTSFKEIGMIGIGDMGLTSMQMFDAGSSTKADDYYTLSKKNENVVTCTYVDDPTGTLAKNPAHLALVKSGNVVVGWLSPR